MSIIFKSQSQLSQSLYNYLRRYHLDIISMGKCFLGSKPIIHKQAGKKNQL